MRFLFKDLNISIIFSLLLSIKLGRRQRFESCLQLNFSFRKNLYDSRRNLKSSVSSIAAKASNFNDFNLIITVIQKFHTKHWKFTISYDVYVRVRR